MLFPSINTNLSIDISSLLFDVFLEQLYHIKYDLSIKYVYIHHFLLSTKFAKDDIIYILGYPIKYILSCKNIYYICFTYNSNIWRKKQWKA